MKAATAPGKAILEQLSSGPLHSFALWQRDILPQAAAGIYTIWDIATAAFVYVGIAGIGRARPDEEHGLVKRLRKHCSGARSGDRFCISVQDRFVLRKLTRADIACIGARRMSLDHAVRDHIRAHFGFRFAVTGSGGDARVIESRIKRGAWSGGLPLLNPMGMPD